MAVFFSIHRDGSKFSASADGGAPFPVGQRVRFRNRRSSTDFVGLSNDPGNFGADYAAKLRFEAKDYSDPFGFMADFIEPTAICEGQSFLSLNTYDRARFTFGFGQFAAHEPEGDFIRWFRDMLGRPEATDYFPNIEVRNGEIRKVGAGGDTVLADKSSTKGLCDYFNPTLGDIEDAEVIAAAKFMHWSTNHQGARLLQVQHMVNTALLYVKQSDRVLNLDGRSADICALVFDIRHQGRGGYDDMLDALKSPQPYDALLTVGKLGEPGRIANLTKAMKTRRAGLQAKAWSRARGAFV